MELLLFTSPTCAPCRVVKPKVIQFAQTRQLPLRLIDTTTDTRTSDQYLIQSVPTLIVLDEHGVAEQRASGLDILKTLKAI